MKKIKVLNSALEYTLENGRWTFDGEQVTNSTLISILEKYLELEDEGDIVIDLALEDSDMVLLDYKDREDIEIVNAYLSQFGQVDDDLWDNFNLDEDEFVETDDMGFLHKDDLEEIASIASYYGSSDMVDSTTTIYQVLNEEGEVDFFVLNPENDDNFYSYEHLDDMELQEGEIWEQTDDEFRKLYFKDRVKNIKFFVEFYDEANHFMKEEAISSYLPLEEDNPAYSFAYIGLSEDAENTDIIVFYKNNCNVSVADRLKGFEIELNDILDFPNNAYEIYEKHYEVFSTYSVIEKDLLEIKDALPELIEKGLEVDSPELLRRNMMLKTQLDKRN